MQIPLRTTSPVEDYVARQEWRGARLLRCPLHPHGHCSLQRHGSYARLSSPGVRIARWYCPQGRTTFSLLPDFLAARLPGLLSAIERAAIGVASASSMEVAADAMRGLDIGLPGAVRWLRRRVKAVQRSLAVVQLIAPWLTPDAPTCDVTDDDALILLRLRRALPLPALNCIPAPLGFASVATGDGGAIPALSGGRPCPVSGAASSEDSRPHDMGPDGLFAARYAASVNQRERRCRPNDVSHPPPRILLASGMPIVI